MAVNANEFILQGFGGGRDPAQALNEYSNHLWQRNMQRQQLELQREAKRQQAGNFLRQYLEPKDYLTGTAYDPVINEGLQQALQQGAQLAEQGADIPNLITALAPSLRQITDYSTKAKVVNQQVDNVIKTMKESGLMGYDYGKLKDQALRTAFHHYDEKTGADLGLRNIEEVDPSINYAMRALEEHPDKITTAEGLDQFVKAYPQYKNSTDATTYTPNNRKTRNKINMVGQGYLVPEVDNEGVVTGLVPSYEHATEAGQPLVHDFIGPNGERVQAPVRLLDEGYFNEAVSHKGVGDWLRGQVRQHLNEYRDRTGQPISMNSVQAHNVARAILYDELKRRSPGSIQFVEELNKPSAAEIQRRTFGDKRQQAYDYELGRQEARKDLGLPPTGGGASEKPLNVVETLHQIFNNNEDYLKGDIVNKNGHDVVEVTPFFKNATLKFGRGQTGTYEHVYYDPVRRKLLMEEKDDPTNLHEQGEAGLKDFAKKIAAVNNINVGAVDPSFRSAGWNEKNQSYKAPGTGTEINQRLTDRTNERRQKLAKGIDNLTTNGKAPELKGMNFKEGKITDAGVPFWSGKYFIEYTDKTGKSQTKKFKSDAELKAFLFDQPEASPQPSATAPNTISKEQEEVLKRHGG